MEACSDCKRFTETVTDNCTGDTICTECGLVIDHHFISLMAEWRNFADDDNNNGDPNRVGAPTNHLLKSGGLSTVIKAPQKSTSSVSVSKKDLSELCRAQNSVKDPDEDLITKACKEIKRITDALVLDKVIEFRACEIISKVDTNNNKSLRRAKNLTALCAASVSTACRELRVSRTLKEISMVVKGVELKHINKASMAIKSLLGSDQDEAAASQPQPQVIINTTELVRRFCSRLNLSPREAMAIRQAVEKAENFDIRRNPKSVLAAIIFMVCQLSDQNNRVPIREIGMAAEVVENTLKGSFKDVYPYASKIIPQWYASEADITKRLRGIVGSWDSAKVTV